MTTTVSDAYRKTPVDPARSKHDIEGLLLKVGADIKLLPEPRRGGPMNGA